MANVVKNAQQGKNMYIAHFQEFILLRVRYIERFCKGLLSQREQTLLGVRIVERLL